jgi:hypothetical protein
MRVGRALWVARWFRVTMVCFVIGSIAIVAAASSADVYWVQVGIFRDPEAAKRVAQRLRGRKYQVQESIVKQPNAPGPTTGATGPTPTLGGGARYEVVVSGGASTELTAKVSAKGLTGRPSTEGVVITPSLPLSEAVALSRDLADAGLAVRVRRVDAPPGSASREHEAGATGGMDMLHRVRVGSFADRAAAMAALRELEGLGYKPFLARGSE